ncbi:hexokinase [Aspergillus sclerotialis]|uniref:Phosphotransferase n=1 Tax=Aspergillus sclerotialis TaxID=2070753 RepID=A0A3A2ZJH1_9EURO|nr:hexokinase [Aspergillus sclerotialis]
MTVGDESYGNVPPAVAVEVEMIKNSFSVDKDTLRKITGHFASQLEKGLASYDSEIPMNVTWVTGYPNGKESGSYITVDMGGTNLRVCQVVLTEEPGGHNVAQEKFKLPDNVRGGSADELWGFIADSLDAFLRKYTVKRQSEKLPMAFTFSYPVTQNNIRHGILQRWTKGFDVSGVEGYDVIEQLEQVLQRKNLPVTIVALVNDTTGTLIAGAYKDPEIKIGCIFSTGCNAAYMEDVDSIPKISKSGLRPGTEIAINTEYGAFDNSHHVLPRTQFDHTVDKESTRPGQQTYEKMVAGHYVGELMRLMLVHLHKRAGMFSQSDCSKLNCNNAFDSKILAAIDEDNTESHTGIRDILKRFNIDPTPYELEVCAILAETICTRAARLYACGIAAICQKKRIQRCHVGVDGSMFSNYSKFRKRAAATLREILNWPDGSEDQILLCPAEDGSSIGAALIAALSLRSD